jgi:hypothetical protein
LGYYKLACQGKTQLLTRFNIVFKEPQTTTGYKKAESAKFLRLANTYYFKIGEKAPIQVSKKKDLESIFGNKSKDIISFVKKEKLSFKKEKDLIILTEFINKMD